ncbi:MAG: CCA tRNA nucleotidyltransferase [Candidatus Omnitrophota bacterium]|nr:CCA tRNA nucleotidyltransferase [Candidatus Omnitrophota bacterium]
MKKYLEKLPQEMRGLIKLVGDVAAQKNMRVYLVGGFVRDLLLGATNLDLDVVVEGDGISFAEDVAAELGSKLIRHHAFGTATIVSGHHLKIDVATARKEAYASPAQLPVVQPGSLKDDLFRRDFTINAMAVDINPNDFGRLIDFYGGISDLKNKKVRVLHDLSFFDDPTRILRAVRFEQRYGFHIEPRTLKRLKGAAKRGMLEAVEPQRMRDELILMLKEKEPIKALERLHRIGGLAFIKKGLKFTNKTRALLNAVKKEIAWFGKNFPHRRRLDKWLMYFMALIDALSVKDTENICARFAFCKGETKRMACFKRLRPAFFRALSTAGLKPSRIFSLLEPLPYEVILLAKAKFKFPALQLHISGFFRIYNGTRIQVTGCDLQKMGCLPGPHYQEILKKILRAKLDGRAVSRQEELSLACEIIHRQRL